MKKRSKMGMKGFLIAGLIFCLVCLVTIGVGCACPILTGPRLTLRHTPFHPGNNQNVTFQIHATDGEGVKEIRLYVYEYELYLNNGVASANIRAGGTWGLVKTWNISPSSTNVDVSHTLSGFPANSLITYKAVVIDTDGTSKDGEIGFAAGDWPWPHLAIPLYGHGAPASRIDICFVPDEDYNQNWATFLADMEDLLYNGYFLNEMVNNYRGNWYFYYTRNEGDANESPRRLVLPPQASSMTNIDVFAILHNTVFRDARSGNKFTTEPVNIGTAVHETGHAVFNLADEYCCDGGYWELTTHANLYDTQTECQDHNRSHGWPENDCTEFTATNGNKWYRPEPSSLGCIMRDDGDSIMRQFARTCQLRIVWYYMQLASP